jgi:DNA polymerase III epsilon subunit-like protein
VRTPYELVIFDLETNGMNGEEVRITEIGAVRLSRDLEIIDEFESLVSGGPIPQRIQDLTGITDAMVATAPDFSKIAKDFAKWCGNRNKYRLGAWGAYYDINVLRTAHRRVNIPYPHPGAALDIKAIVWFHSWGQSGKTNKSGGLGALADRYGIEFDGQPHRALSDAKTAAHLLKQITHPERV